MVCIVTIKISLFLKFSHCRVPSTHIKLHYYYSTPAAHNKNSVPFFTPTKLPRWLILSAYTSGTRFMHMTSVS